MTDLRIALIGGGFMGKAHALGYVAAPMFFSAAVRPIRQVLVEQTEAFAAAQAHRYGFERWTTDWREVVADPRIDAVDIATPNDSHAEIAIAAAEAGKHILCEKPLARTADEAATMLSAVQRAGVIHMTAFNFRRTPAIALAREILDEGRLGTIQNFRGTYLQDWPADPDHPYAWRFQRAAAGSGAVGDIASHVLDIARYLVGEVSEVTAMTRRYIDQRPIPDPTGGEQTPRYGKVDVDDEVLALLRFEGGAVGSLEATRVAHGRHNYLTFEIHGSGGTLCFDYEQRDQLRVAYADEPANRRGFRTIYTGPPHPYGEGLWPGPALGIGYGETKIIECHEFLTAVAEQRPATPDFEDGYRVARIADALLASAETSTWTPVAR
ncbi:Gfo/Idh/MocA family oxidoreductase [Natronosporangium hydrolyticum]|uniref:Gfo/Idh/MocA family oxidoreductase n=1 Tax=Natronosporangium hydrolyticum TaxID=2811111 RepID=A0A895YJ21_9ACTN|nr:Gfo/Idh/MocA family oxidoreductase [Natronosporangium hydrolyticum]QSB15363.1 Gfo/Idh/MocA family oxidoreductase [Natronosporangium hydrolyticum]